MSDHLGGALSIYGLVGFVLFLPWIPVQRTINEINAQERPGLEINSRFTPVNMLFIGIGVVLFLLGLVSAAISTGLIG